MEDVLADLATDMPAPSHPVDRQHSPIQRQKGIVILLDVLGAGEGDENLINLILSLDEDYDLIESGARRMNQNAQKILGAQNELAEVLASLKKEKLIHWGYGLPSMSVFGDSIAMTAPFHGLQDPLSAKSFKHSYFQEDHAQVMLEGDDFCALIGTVYAMHFLRDSVLRSIFRGSPLRGCVSFGEFVEYSHKGGTRLLGPAVVEVAREYEAADWIGITTSSSLTARLQNLNSLISKRVHTTCMHYYEKVPRARDTTFSAFALSWASGYFTALKPGRSHSRTMSNDVFRDRIVSRFYEVVRMGQPHFDQLPLRARKKYSNTQEFIEWCCLQQPFKDLVVDLANVPGRPAVLTPLNPLNPRRSP